MIKTIHQADCTGCGICDEVCPLDVIRLDNASGKAYIAYPEDCMTCFLCELECPEGAKDAHYLMKLIEVRSIAFVAELFLRASLMRTESRAGHYREDYPRRDDKNWLQWIIISRQDNKLNLSTKPVPFDKYKFKITRCYSDNFDFTKSG